MDGGEDRAAGRVRGMFNGIAGRYDVVNHVLSLNRDRAWRREAARRIVAGKHDVVLDLCGGTGDLTAAVARAGRPRAVICCDFAHGMLERARPKLSRPGLAGRCVVLEADGLRLPFADGAVDAVGIAFGVRNFADLDAGMREVCRVLAPGGRMVVLEFSRPTGPVLSRAYRLYLERVLPRIGDWIAGSTGPYAYLARTIGEFPDPVTLAGRIREAGFAACGWETLSGGIVALHTALRGR